MKKGPLTIALSVVAAGAAFAQGQINFNNTSATLGRVALVTNANTGTALTGTNFVAQLFFASDAANPLANAAVLEAASFFRQPTTTQPGTWSGGSRTFVASVNQGDTINLIVRVWDNSFANFAASFAAGIGGQSVSFAYVVPVNPPSASSLIMNNFQGFAVPTVVPEPTTIALGLLGAGSLLFLRRKK